ncbi:AAA family ATPase [Ramlibacter sp.]|uniref:AAA family ATPase n=1 Tax=Ramlibacter sp. TaxID=1917967 RepID=UPI003D109827
MASPVGRERESGQLGAALDAALAGGRRVVLVAGTAGVGKSSLIARLQPRVEACGGRFVACKFDQSAVRETTAVLQALGTFGQRLVEEGSADERAQVRGAVLRVLGANAGLARAVPGFATLLADVPDPRAVDAAYAAARMAEVVAGLLRAVASRTQPLVLVLDDLQWGGVLCTRLIDAVLAGHEAAGLLVVAAYRDDAIDGAHPLASAIARWMQERSGLQILALRNLEAEASARLVASAAALAPPLAVRLAALLQPHAAGNPFYTLELLAALRSESLLRGEGHAAVWDDAAVRDFLARHSVDSVLGARIARLPADARELLRGLAFLGLQTPERVARAATALWTAAFDSALQVLRERGFVLPGGTRDGTIHLCHDRVQQAARSSLDEGARREVQLGLARRLARAREFEVAAAEQYVAAVDGIAAEERASAIALLSDAAVRMRRIGGHPAACRMLKAALELLETAQAAGQTDDAEVLACELDYHQALYGAGRFAEADAIYGRIAARGLETLEVADAACSQVISLTGRDRMPEAIALGLAVLRELGLDVPRHFGPGAEFEAQYDAMCAWVRSFDPEREVARADTASERIAATARMIDALMSPAFFANMHLLVWLVFRSQLLWREHGPSAALVGTLARAGNATSTLKEDPLTGYLAVRQALELCEARAWEHEAAQVRFHALVLMNNFEPMERHVAEAMRAREALLASGDLRKASFSARYAATGLLHCGASLRQAGEEIEAAMALSLRAGNRQAVARCLADRELVGVLRGDLPGMAFASNFESASGLGAATRTTQDWMVGYVAVLGAIACAILGDAPGLARHLRTVRQSSSTGTASAHLNGHFHWLSGLAAAYGIREGAEGEVGKSRAETRADLDACCEWLRQRAIDAPSNFRHLHLHLLGERAWAFGDVAAAARLFDEAMDATEPVHRPWHFALITEQCARLHLASGWHFSGRSLMAEARELYRTWGAAAKVAQLDAETGANDGGAARHSAAAPAPAPAPAPDDVDGLALLRAARALRTERSPIELQARLEEVLACIAGATHAVLLPWDEDTQAWIPSRAEASPQHRPPAAVLRYVRRTRKPLLVADALADVRFAGDPCYAGLACCSLLAVPIVHGGRLRGLLVLENRGVRGGFNADRLEAVETIAGHLAESLQCGMLLARLEGKAGEQTRQLREAQVRLMEDALHAGRAQVAINVLHNVGNVLTSVNVASHVLVDRVHGSRSARVADLAWLVETRVREPAFFGEGGAGRLLPGYVRQLAEALGAERDALLAELRTIDASIGDIRDVIARQQSYAVAHPIRSGLPERTPSSLSTT